MTDIPKKKDLSMHAHANGTVALDNSNQATY